MKKVILLALIFFLPLSMQAIDIDGDMDDWDSIGTSYTITDSEDIDGNWYYYDTEWEENCPEEIEGECNAISINQEKMLDIENFKITNSNDYIYFYWQNAEPFASVKLANGIHGDWHGYGAPAAFDDWLVVGFDETDDDEADYFYAINIAWDSNGNGFPDDNNPSSYLYQDNGDGTFSSSEETLLKEISVSSSDWAIEGSNYSPELEVRYSMSDFLEYTNIDSTTELDVTTMTSATIGESTDYLSFTLQDAGSDSAIPSNLRATGVKSNQVYMRWDEVLSADDYQVQLRLDDGSLVNNYYVSDTYKKIGKKITVTNQEYKFRVRAQINDEYSDWSDYTEFQTLPAKPKNLTINKKQADQSKLSWTKPRGTITKYRVKLYSSKNKLVRSYITSKTKKALKSLSPDNQYKVKVRAYNGSDWGRFSKKKTLKTDTINYYLKIKDLTKANLDIRTPGADVDSIKITQDDASYHYVTEVVKHRILNGVQGNSNAFSDPYKILGGSDDKYVSMGGIGSYMVVKFEVPVNYQSKNITVRELGSATGGLDETVRVYIGKTDHGPWRAMGTGTGEFILKN